MDLYKNLHMWIEDNKYERLKNKWHSEIFNSREDSEDLDGELLDTIE
ncbi:regulator [Lysinibacillus xylanilyticus]